MKNLYCFQEFNCNNSNFVFQELEAPHEQMGERPLRPKESQEAKKSPEQLMLEAFERLEKSDIAHVLKLICDIYMARNYEHPEAKIIFLTYRKWMIEKNGGVGLNLDLITLKKQMETMSEVYMASHPEVAAKIMEGKIRMPELMWAMFEEMFLDAEQALEFFRGKGVVRGMTFEDRKADLKQLKNKCYQLLYQVK